MSGESREERPMPADEEHLLGSSRSRETAASLAFVAIVVFVASLATGVHKGLPTLAFQWKFGLVLVRAAVAYAIFVVVFIFLARGWAGSWPQRVSTTSIDWEQVAEGSDRLRHGMREINELELAVAREREQRSES